MTVSTDALIVAGVIIAALCALVSIGFALWEVGRAWWTPGDVPPPSTRPRDDWRGRSR